MIEAPLGDYRPPATADRATLVAGIALLHAGLLAALAAAHGPIEILRAAAPMEVRLVAPQSLPVEPARHVLPAPRMRVPDIALPVPPAIEIAMNPAPAPVAAITVAPAAPPARPSAPSEGPAVEPPRHDLAYLRNPAPAYPPLSRRLKEEGRVLLRVQVDAGGEVLAVELASTSGHARLDQAALSAVRHWRFTPARSADRSLAGWALVPIVFQLHA